jgi:cell division protein FtsW
MKLAKSKNDIILVAAVTVLLTLGLIIVFSASAVVAHEQYGSVLYYLRKQIFWGFLSIFSIFLFSRIKLELFSTRFVAIIGVILSFLFLIGLFPFGSVVNGAKRWYNIGFASFQPSETAKLALIIYFAYIFSQKGSQLSDWKKGLLPQTLVFGLILIPIFFQPDLGTVIMISLIIGTMALLSNIRLKHVFAGLLFMAPALLLKIKSSGYQIDRLRDWYNNLNNPLGSGYQIKQSLIGFGNGGLFGSGIGTSKQKFFFLPDSHTDFVFAIVGEELGFIGTTVILLLFIAILWRGISIARRAGSPFEQFLAVGLTMNLVLYGMMNAAVATMLIPTTGMPMPFLSYGGSSLLVVGISVGLLINMSRRINASTLNGRVSQFRNSRKELHRSLIMTD